ncbi:flagellar basal body-associated FliL family protein [Desulfospira joergensenii]|uniref:flagellar basal body-associated FliL family protein n=1 Tax=Desulfospira joergensenii TaxID=53329 RepID=UPI000410AA04|nr:flagellar basal body-associated FliL family protein [Desulfospira joergensenii]
MRRFLIFWLFLALIPLGCGEKTQSKEELVQGNWILFRNRTYILLILNPKGEWQSSVRIADATSKIVKSKGDAKGTWHLEEEQLIFTVMDSSIEEVWEKNTTSFFEIVELGASVMKLRAENGNLAEWKKTTTGKSGKEQESSSLMIPMEPIAVNLNKISSNTKDRYLCLKMRLVLQELMPGQKVPRLHPRAREAAMVFLSSLIYNDVKDFDRVKAQKAKLLKVLNPYMEGAIKDIEIEHVIVTDTHEKVEEFLIEHTIPSGAPAEGEEADSKDKAAG